MKTMIENVKNAALTIATKVKEIAMDPDVQSVATGFGGGVVVGAMLMEAFG